MLLTALKSDKSPQQAIVNFLYTFVHWCGDAVDTDNMEQIKQFVQASETKVLLELTDEMDELIAAKMENKTDDIVIRKDDWYYRITQPPTTERGKL